MNKSDIRTAGLLSIFLGLFFVLVAFYAIPHFDLIFDNPNGYKRLQESAMWYLGFGEMFSFAGFALLWAGRDKSY